MRQAGISFVDPGSDLVAVVIVLLATTLASAVTIKTGSRPYAATIIWALVGVGAANIYREDRPVIVIATALAIAVIITIAVNSRRKLAA